MESGDSEGMEGDGRGRLVCLLLPQVEEPGYWEKGVGRGITAYRHVEEEENRQDRCNEIIPEAMWEQRVNVSHK